MGVPGDVDAGVGFAAGGACSWLTEGDLNPGMLLRSLSLIDPASSASGSALFAAGRDALLPVGAQGWSPSSLPVEWRSPGLRSRGPREPSCVWWTCQSLVVLRPTHAQCPVGNS